MQSPFRPRGLLSPGLGSSRTPQTPSGEICCSRHPRSWVERKVFFVTKKRECPYCELERATVVRRTAVFNPTQTPRNEPPGRPPRGGGGGSGAGTSTPRSKGHRRSSSSSSPSSSTPSSSSHRRRKSGDASSLSKHQHGGVPRQRRKSSSPRKAEDDANDGGAPSPAVLPPTHPTIDASPARQPKSLMFTSMARRRASLTPAKASAKSAAAEPPPSPSGSEISVPGSGFGEGRRLSSSFGSGRFGLVLPPSIPDDDASGFGVRVPSPLSGEAGAAGTAEGGAADGNIDAATTTSHDIRGARLSPVGRARSAVDAVVAAVEEEAGTAATAVRGAVRPVAAAMVKLAVALEALSAVGGGGVGGRGPPEGALEAAGVASAAVKEVEVLAGGDEEDEEEETETAAAVLSDAGYAVETLAQTTRALVWSGKEPSSLRESATFVEQHRSATEAVSEAARRAQLLLGSLATDGKPPSKETAAAQRLWLAVLDHHEACMRRRDSKKALLMAEQEIPSGTVTILKDCLLRREGVLGTTYAAEYLGMPMSATVLMDRDLTTATPAEEERDPATKPSGGSSAAALRSAAAAELRELAAVLPTHSRLARTHGHEMVTPSVVIRLVNGGGVAESGDRPEGGGDYEVPPVAALVLVGELVDGGSLRERIVSAVAAADEDNGLVAWKWEEVSPMARQGREGGDAVAAATGPWALPRRRVLADVAEGLAYLHGRGLFHGALSSENVLLDAGGRAKLSLFGLTKTRKAAAALNADVGVDSGACMAPISVYTPPEALAGVAAAAEPVAAEVEKEAGVAADAFAFGMLAWELLTGRQPWEGLTVQEVSAKVSSGARPELPYFDDITLDGYDHFGDLVRTLWAQDPKARPALGDVARGLRVPEPRHAAPIVVAVPSSVADDAEVDVEVVSADEGVESSGCVALEEQAVAANEEVVAANEETVSEEGRGGEGERGGVVVEEEEEEDWADAEDGSGGVSVLAAVAESVSWVAGDEAGCPGSHGACGGSATPSGSGGGGETLLAASSASLPSLDLPDDGRSEVMLTTLLEQQSPACVVDGLKRGGELNAPVETAYTGPVESERESAPPKVDSNVDGDRKALHEEDGATEYADAMGSLPWVAPDNSAVPPAAPAGALEGNKYITMTPPRGKDDRQVAQSAAVGVPGGPPAGSAAPQHLGVAATQSPQCTPPERLGYYTTPLLSACSLGSVDSGPSPPEPDWDSLFNDGISSRLSASRVTGRRSGILMRPVETSAYAARSAENAASGGCPSGTGEKVEGEDQACSSASQQDLTVDVGGTANQTVALRETASAYTVAPGVEDSSVRSGLPNAAAVAAALTAAAPPLAGGAAGAAPSSEPRSAQAVQVTVKTSRPQSSSKADPQLPDVSSPDPSQLSNTSRGGATAVLTPLPAAATPAPAASATTKEASPPRSSLPRASMAMPVRAEASSSPVKGGAMVDTSGGMGPLAGDVAGGGGVSSRTQSKSGAGTKMRGFASSLTWFRKRRKNRGSNVVEGFPLQER